MKENPIVREVSDFLVRPILLFAVYVQMHGDYGPGGGFQAGVIFAAGIILYTLVHGLEKARSLISPKLITHLTALGLLLYAGVGVVSMFRGGNYLDYSVLTHDAHHGQHLGILLIELGVGITVASVMILIFFSFAGRRK